MIIIIQDLVRINNLAKQNSLQEENFGIQQQTLLDRKRETLERFGIWDLLDRVEKRSLNFAPGLKRWEKDLVRLRTVDLDNIPATKYINVVSPLMFLFLTARPRRGRLGGRGHNYLLSFQFAPKYKKRQKRRRPRHVISIYQNRHYGGQERSGRPGQRKRDSGADDAFSGATDVLIKISFDGNLSI